MRISAPRWSSAADRNRALRLLAAGGAPIVELPAPLLRGLAAWLLAKASEEGAEGASRSGRQLRASSAKLLDSLRLRSRGFADEKEAHELAPPEWSTLLPPSARAALTAEEASAVEPPPSYRDREVDAYAAARLPCTFSALQRVFEEARTHGALDTRPRTDSSGAAGCCATARLQAGTTS
jgi:hypothetical protein